MEFFFNLQKKSKMQLQSEAVEQFLENQKWNLHMQLRKYLWIPLNSHAVVKRPVWRGAIWEVRRVRMEAPQMAAVPAQRGGGAPALPLSLSLSLSLSPEKTRGVSSPSKEEMHPPLTLLAPYLGFPIPRMVRNKCDKCPKPPSFRYFAVTL